VIADTLKNHYASYSDFFFSVSGTYGRNCILAVELKDFFKGYPKTFDEFLVGALLTIHSRYLLYPPYPPFS
jgi:hypothetical protein